MATLKEWIDSVEFKSIAQWIIKHDKKAEDNMPDYKMAFDRIRLMIPAEDDGIKIIMEMIGYGDGKLQFYLCHTLKVRLLGNMIWQGKLLLQMA